MAESSFYVLPSAGAFTPGDLTPQGNQYASAYPPGPALGQVPAPVPVAPHTPIVGLVAIVLVVLFFEHRRIRKGIK